MPIRTSEATWTGPVRDGKGEMAFGSGTWRGPYSFRSRFTDDEPTQSNPEELLAGGHAGCFSLALANILEQADHEPEKIQTTAHCHLEMDREAGPTISRIELITKGQVPDISEDTFHRIANEAKTGCPVSRALSDSIKITLDATLVE